MMKAALALGLGLTLSGSAALAQDPPAWSQPTAPFKIIDNTYYVGTAGLSVYLIATKQGLILIDSGLPQNAALVEASIKKLGFKLSDVKFILSSHAHFDHAGGLAKLKADTGAWFTANEGDKYAFEKGVYPGSEERKDFNFPPVKVDGGIPDGGQVKLGGVTVTAHLTPGHTKGCTTWTWPVRDKDGSAHTAINFCSASVAANSLSPEQYPGIVADYRTTFAKASKLDGDVFLAPHAEQFNMPAKWAKLGKPGPNPFIDRAGYLDLVASQAADFNKSLAAQAKAKSQ
jgi:metallo-beta-lactamase class B